jgi:two-component system response regulator AtoC
VKGRILIVDDESDFRQFITNTLSETGIEVHQASSGAEALEFLTHTPVTAVLADLVMPEMSGMELLKTIRKRWPLIKVVILTGYGTVQNAVEAMKLGAFSFILKPIDVQALLHEIDCIMGKQKKTQSHLADLPMEVQVLESRNQRMRQIYRLTIDRIAKSSAAVLIQGESGTGKELLARAIHDYSLRHRKPFVKVNAAALPEGVLESELFGHVKGAFTGAIKDRPGRFQQANQGTLFLDEIGDLSGTIQVKLLRVLQEKEFERVGSTQTIKVDVRIISATNQNIQQAVKQGTFREDLFYRLNVIALELPPLRERREDIPCLVQHFLKKFKPASRRNPHFITQRTLETLCAYSWPGNVRQLENAVERAVVMAGTNTVDLQDLPPEITAANEDPDLKSPTLKQAKSQFERELVVKALAKNRGNVSAAATELDIARKNLQEKIKKHHINIHEFRAKTPAPDTVE